MSWNVLVTDVNVGIITKPTRLTQNRSWKRLQLINIVVHHSSHTAILTTRIVMGNIIVKTAVSHYIYSHFHLIFGVTFYIKEKRIVQETHIITAALYTEIISSA